VGEIEERDSKNSEGALLAHVRTIHNHYQQGHITNEEKIIQMAEFAGIRDSLLGLPQQTIAKNAKGENAVGT
jgi:rhodanese-related sulfurtransferase